MARGQPVDLLSQRNLEWHHQTKCLVFSVTLARHHAAWSSAVSTQRLDRRGQHLEGRKEEINGGRKEERKGGRQAFFPYSWWSTTLSAKTAFLTSPSFKLPFLVYFKGKPLRGKRPWAIAPFACHLLARFCTWLRWGQSAIFSMPRNAYYVKGWPDHQWKSHVRAVWAIWVRPGRGHQNPPSLHNSTIYFFSSFMVPNCHTDTEMCH